MSSDADAGAAAFVALFNTLYTEKFFTLAASTLFIYDNLIILNREVECFWTAKCTGAPLLFFANKWISMAIYVLALVISRSFPSDRILQVVPGAAFAALRAYVLSRSKLVGLLILALSLAPAAVNLVPYGYQVSGINYPPFGCLELDNVTNAIGLKLVVISRVPLIVADMLLLYITWTKLRSRGLRSEISQSKRLSLSDVLFCDGMVYFVVLFVLNILHLVLSLPALGIESHGGSDVTTFTGPLTAILISRFLLDLQEANKAVIRVDGDYPLHSSGRDPYNTPSFISSLGAFINPDHPTRSDDELESHVVFRSDEEDKGGAQVSESQAAVVS